MKQFSLKNKGVLFVFIVMITTTLSFFIYIWVSNKQMNIILNQATTVMDTHLSYHQVALDEVTRIYTMDSKIKWLDANKNSKMTTELFKEVHGTSYEAYRYKPVDTYYIQESLYTLESPSKVDFYFRVKYSNSISTVLVTVEDGYVVNLINIDKGVIE